MTNVPALIISPTGPVLPDASAILAGVQADWQAAFGGKLSTMPNNPFGQITTSEMEVINDAYGTFASIVAGTDPATATGRMQDGIGRLYYQTRKGATSTVVSLTCWGATNTVIPINAKAKDRAGRVWLATQTGTITSSGFVILTFACKDTGPIAAPAGYVDDIYQALPGWDSCVNAADGVIGTDVESPAQFEFRRAQSVAANSIGQTGAVLGALLDLDGVLDAYTLENPKGVTSGAGFIGSITGNVLDVTELDDGEIEQGQMLLGGVSGTVVTGTLTGAGGVGTYTVSIPQTLSSRALQSAPGGVRMLPNSILASVVGGSAPDVGNAIFRKKNPGCSYNGTTSVVVQDTNPAYADPKPSYTVKWLTPAPTGVKFSILMQNNGAIPADAVPKIKAALIAAFSGTDGGQKARIASGIFASRYYAGIAALGPWALIYKILVGIDAADQDSILMRADQVPTLSDADISIAFS